MFLATSPKTYAATGDITAVRIAGDTTHNGWTAEIDIAGLATGGSYNLGMGPNSDPTNAKITFTVSSPGFDTTGAAATTTRTIYATKYVRLPYPSNASVDESTSGGTLTIKVALSDFIYAADTSITANISSGVYTKTSVPNNASSSVSVVNNSTLQYPKSVGRWAWPGYERVTGDFLVEAVAFNRFAKNGKPLAAMVFTANDQHGHTVTQTVTDMTVSTRSGDANSVQVYAATIPVSTLTQSDIIEVNFKAYPWVGTSSAILNSATTSNGYAQPNERLGPIYEINDKSGTYGYAYAYVNPRGSDTTGTVYSTQSAAEAGSAFLTIKKASDAIQTYNNSNYSRNEAGGGTILLGAGTTTYPGLSTVDVGTMNTWLTITRTSTTSKSAVILDTDGNNRTSRITRLKITGITIKSSSASTIITGRTATDALWLHDNIIDRTGTGIVAFSTAAAYATQNSIVNHDATGFSPFSTTHSGWALIRGNTNTAATAIKGDVYALLGNSGVTPLFKENANSSGQAASDNSVFAYNSLYGITSAPNSFSMTSTSTGLAVIGNVMEKTTTTELLFCVSCDLSSATTSNVMIWHNTFAGERGNFGYNEDGTAYLGRYNWSQKFNVFEEWNTKTDDFVGGGAANGNRTGNWPIVYNVGSFSNISKQENFRGEFDGLSAVYGPTTGTLDIGFTSDKSYVGTAAGNGTYTLLATSTAIDFATTTSNAQAVLPYDFLGNARYGIPDPGAYEYQPLYTMGTHNVATSSVVRVYGDEKWRVKTATTSSGTAAMSLSLSGSDTSQWVDIAISLWNTTGTYHKTWTETSSSTGLTNTVHIIGGLGANALFQVKVDNVVGQDMTGASCTAGVCTSNGSGQITFTYTGTYASKRTFDVISNPIPDTVSPTVEMTVPSNAATVGGAAVTVTASSSDDVAVGGVLFKVDTNTEMAAEVTDAPYTISWDSTGVADGSHTIIAVARDGSNNRATSSSITVTVDNTAPTRSAGSPSGTLSLGTTGTTLSLTTNEAATCKYSTSADTAYGSMTAFDTTGGTSHSTAVTGLSNGISYSYYVKCSDAVSNINATDYTISFAVAGDTTNPTVSMTAPSNSATVSGASVSLTANASDDVIVAGVQFKVDTNTLIGSEDTSSPYAVTWDSTGIADGSHTLIAVARDGTNNRATSSAITITVDNTAPVRSAGAPSTALALNTSTTTISLTTNETATCKYSTNPGTAYGSMTSFSTTTSTSHTTVVSGLSNGGSYSYYVKCSDAQSNTNATDYTISFTVTADTTAPTVSMTAPTDGSTVSGASVSLTASASDDVAVAGVQFKVDTNTNIGSEDTTSTYGVTWDSTGVSDGIHTLIAVGRDTTNNRATSTAITVLVDNTAPVRSAGSPSDTLSINTTSTTLSLSTDEAATCKYSTSASTAYGSMTAFSTTGGTSHSSTISGLSNGGSYVYYVKCADARGVTNATDYSISFSVAGDATAPTASLTAPLNNAVVSGASVSLTATANDDVSVSGVQFKVDTNTNIGSEDTSAPYAVTWDSTGVADGSHSLIAVARDGTGHYGTSSIVTVTVDNTAPTRSAGSPSGALSAGTNATTISLTTNETATCKYSTNSGASYASMTTFTTTGETTHSALISGLADSTSYSYYVKCSDDQGNINATNYTISFSVDADTTAPTVTLTLPLGVSTISGGAVTMAATASDNEAVAGVQFKVDTNTLVGSEDTSSPFTTTWDSTSVADGSHTVIAVARDTTNNRATSSPVSIVVDNTAPVRSIGSPSGTLAYTTTGATLSLTTNEAATCKYSTSAGTTYGSMTAFSTTTETSHSTALTGLTDSTSYAYYVKCADGQGNINVTDYTISFSVAAPPDTTAPVISSVAASAGETTATITWTTNEAADSQVSYGESSTYTASSTLDTSLVTSHSVALSGLTANTTYHYQVSSVDASDNTATSSDTTFTTTSGTVNTVTRRTSSGGGGGGSRAPSASPSAASSASASAGGAPVGSSGSPLSGGSTSGITRVVSSLNSVGQSSFTRAAGLRSVGEEVRALQKFLNVAGFTVALAGPGSFGRETNVFGAATRNALMQFQKANGIDPTGYFGPLTRAAVNASLISSVGTGGAPAGTPNTPSTPSTGSANNAGNNAGGASGKVFTRSLATGNTGNDVKTLQKFLNTRGFTIAQTGPGSPGRETTVFGDATQYQLRQFQKANGIPATGFFGPQTKAKIEALMKR
jgi:hypothetical protein